MRWSSAPAASAARLRSISPPAGIGRLTIADSDKVDLTNLQRQILYRTDSVGAVKVEAAQTALKALNPDVEVVALAQARRRISPTW